MDNKPAKSPPPNFIRRNIENVETNSRRRSGTPGRRSQTPERTSAPPLAVSNMPQRLDLQQARDQIKREKSERKEFLDHLAEPNWRLSNSPENSPNQERSPVNNPTSQSGLPTLAGGIQPTEVPAEQFEEFFDSYENLPFDLPSSPTHPLPHQTPFEQHDPIARTSSDIAASLQPTHPVPHQTPFEQHDPIGRTASDIADSLAGDPLVRARSQPVSEIKTVPISENPAVQACAAIIARTLTVEGVKMLANANSRPAVNEPQETTPDSAANKWGLPTPLSTNPFAQRRPVQHNEARVNPFGGPPATGTIQAPENTGNFGNPFAQPTEATEQHVRPSPRNFAQSSSIGEFADAIATSAQPMLNQAEPVQQSPAQPSPIANQPGLPSSAYHNPFAAPSPSPAQTPGSERLSSHRNSDGSLKPSPDAQEVFRMFEEERKSQIESPYAFAQPSARASASRNFAAPEVSNLAGNVASSLQPEEMTSNPSHQQSESTAPTELDQTLTSTGSAVWTRTPIQGFAQHVARSFDEDLVQPPSEESKPDNMNLDAVQDTENQAASEGTNEPVFGNPPSEFEAWMKAMEAQSNPQVPNPAVNDTPRFEASEELLRSQVAPEIEPFDTDVEVSPKEAKPVQMGASSPTIEAGDSSLPQQMAPGVQGFARNITQSFELSPTQWKPSSTPAVSATPSVNQVAPAVQGFAGNIAQGFDPIQNPETHSTPDLEDQTVAPEVQGFASNIAQGFDPTPDASTPNLVDQPVAPEVLGLFASNIAQGFEPQLRTSTPSDEANKASVPDQSPVQQKAAPEIQGFASNIAQGFEPSTSPQVHKSTPSLETNKASVPNKSPFQQSPAPEIKGFASNIAQGFEPATSPQIPADSEDQLVVPQVQGLANILESFSPAASPVVQTASPAREANKASVPDRSPVQQPTAPEVKGFASNIAQSFESATSAQASPALEANKASASPVQSSTAPDVIGFASNVAVSLHPEEQASPQKQPTIDNTDPQAGASTAPEVQNFANNVATSFFTSPALPPQPSNPQQHSTQSSNARAGTFVANTNTPLFVNRPPLETVPYKTIPSEPESVAKSNTPTRYGDYENRRRDFDTPEGLNPSVNPNASPAVESFIRGDMVQAADVQATGTTPIDPPASSRPSLASSQVVQPRASEPQQSSYQNIFTPLESARNSMPNQSPRQSGQDPRISQPMTLSGTTSMRSSHGETQIKPELENESLFKSMANEDEESNGTVYHTPASSISRASATPPSPLSEKSISLGSHTTPRTTQFDTAAEQTQESQEPSYDSIVLQPVENSQPQELPVIHENTDFGVQVNPSQVSAWVQTSQQYPTPSSQHSFGLQTSPFKSQQVKEASSPDTMVSDQPSSLGQSPMDQEHAEESEDEGEEPMVRGRSSRLARLREEKQKKKRAASADRKKEESPKEKSKRGKSAKTKKEKKDKSKEKAAKPKKETPSPKAKKQEDSPVPEENSASSKKQRPDPKQKVEPIKAQPKSKTQKAKKNAEPKDSPPEAKRKGRERTQKSSPPVETKTVPQKGKKKQTYKAKTAQEIIAEETKHLMLSDGEQAIADQWEIHDAPITDIIKTKRAQAKNKKNAPVRKNRRRA